MKPKVYLNGIKVWHRKTFVYLLASLGLHAASHGVVDKELRQKLVFRSSFRVRVKVVVGEDAKQRRTANSIRA